MALVSSSKSGVELVKKVVVAGVSFLYMVGKSLLCVAFCSIMLASATRANVLRVAPGVNHLRAEDHAHVNGACGNACCLLAPPVLPVTIIIITWLAQLGLFLSRAWIAD